MLSDNKLITNERVLDFDFDYGICKNKNQLIRRILKLYSTKSRITSH